MEIDKYKRDYKFRSEEGTSSVGKWIIIIGGLLVALLAYFFG